MDTPKKPTGRPKAVKKAKKEPYPSRAGYISTYIQKHLWEMLVELGKTDDRSGAYMIRRAVEKLLREAGYDLATGKRTGTP